MSADTRITYLLEFEDRPELIAATRAGLSAAQEEGAITRHRPAPDGSEQIVFIGEASEPEGFATFFGVDEVRVWLDILYVRPEGRQRGLGRVLFRSVAEMARRQGFSRIELGTYADNLTMQQLAQASGMKLEGYYFAGDVAPVGEASHAPA